MTDHELSETLSTAARSVRDNVALEILLLMASERIQQLSVVQTPGNCNEQTN